MKSNLYIRKEELESGIESAGRKIAKLEKEVSYHVGEARSYREQLDDEEVGLSDLEKKLVELELEIEEYDEEDAKDLSDELNVHES